MTLAEVAVQYLPIPEDDFLMWAMEVEWSIMNVTNQNPETLIARADACHRLGNLSPLTLRRWEIKGILTPHKLGSRRVAYLQSDIDRLIAHSRANLT